MPERDEMRERQPRSGRSDEIVMPKVNPELLPGVAEAGPTGAGGGRKPEDWQRYVDAAKKLPQGRARQGLYDQARTELTAELNRAALAGDDRRIAEIAGKLDEVYNLMGAGTTEQKKADPASELAEIRDDANWVGAETSRAEAIRRWVRLWAGKAEARGLMKEANEMLGKFGGKTSIEVEISDVDKVNIRAAMLIHIANLSAGSDPESSFKAFLNEQANRFGWGRHFSPKTEQEFKDEYWARAELATVTAFWDGIAGSLSPDVDAFKEMSAGRIDNCRKLTRDTYMWLSQPGRKMKYKDGEVKEVGDLRVQIDQAAALIYKKINSGSLNLWNTRGQDRVNAITDLARETRSTIPLCEDAVRLAWQLAEAECWVAAKDKAFLSHPAFRLVRFAEHRGFRSANNMPVPGGSRLWVQARREMGRGAGLPSSSVYDQEGVQFSKVGYEAWFKFVPGVDDNGRPVLNRDGSRKIYVMPDLVGGGIALGQGKYLENLRKLMTTQPDFSDIHLPQTEVMTSIVKGSAVFNAIEELGKADPKQLAPKSLRSVRDSMVSALLRFKDGRGVPERMAAARVETGTRLNEWAKTLLWLPSWDNPAHTDETTVMSVAAWFDLFQSLITAYDDDKEWGEYVGFGAGEINEKTNLAVKDRTEARSETVTTKTRNRPTGSGVRMAREYVEWFEKTFYAHIRVLRNKDSSRKPFMTKSRQNQDIIDLGKFDPNYWMATRPGLIGFERRWWLRRR